MIKCDMGIVEFSKDDKRWLKAELSSLIRCLYKEKDFTKEEVLQCVEEAFESDEEVAKKITEHLNEINELVDVLNAINNKKHLPPEKILNALRILEKHGERD